jgi:hypothetical protein
MKDTECAVPPVVTDSESTPPYEVSALLRTKRGKPGQKANWALVWEERMVDGKPRTLNIKEMLQEFIRRDRNWHPPADTPGYKSTVLRSPRRALLSLPQSESEMTGPVFGHGMLDPLDSDLIRNFAADGEAIGERIVVHGQVLDENARPVAGTLIEIWQANAGGRYRHVRDQYIAALDPNFGGGGRCISDA